MSTLKLVGYACSTLLVVRAQEPNAIITPGETVEGYLNQYGIPVQSHYVETDDHYVLHAHRLVRKGAPVILMQHGILGCSFDWISNRPSLSPSIQLWEAGYDVWLTNSRGNTYSRNHTTLATNTKEFWDFSFAALGKHDVPANIKYIVKHSGQKTITYIGHSQGTTSFFVAAQAPETKSIVDKYVNLFVALSPVTFMEHQTSGLLHTITKYRLGALLEKVYPYGFLTSPKTEDGIAHFFCKLTLGAICKITVNWLAGNSAADDPKAITNLTAHFPAGTSAKSLNHYEQLILHGDFREYDNGPAFQLKKISVPTALFTASKDTMGDPDDEVTLRKALSNNKALIYHNEFEGFSHMTWVVGYESARDQWWPELTSLLEKYNPVKASTALTNTSSIIV